MSSTEEKAGAFPYTRGVHADMYRKKLWTMRQYAGFGDAKASNARYRYLLSQGITGLSIAFDLPTQMGYDADDSHALGEVGRVGVAISSLEDMKLVLEGIPLDTVSSSMTINATAPILLALYVAVAQEKGVGLEKLRGTVQNDVLKEYMARGTYVFPPGPSLKLATDLIAYCKEELPQWNSISISGYHIREAGSTAAQELGLTLSDGLAYVQAALARGLKIDEFASRLSFFFNVHNDFIEEVAKFRAARRLWAKLIRERYQPKDDRSLWLRFHAQTAGSSLIASQVDTNVVRVTLQCLAAVLGGAQSIHTNSRDEALGLPTEDAATLALRTQQVIAYESGITKHVDPLGGGELIEKMTDQLESEARALIEQIEKKGGVVKCLEEGFQQKLIQDSAYRYQMDIESEKRIVVGQNKFKSKQAEPTPVFAIDDKVEKDQVARLQAFRASRDKKACELAQKNLLQATKEEKNVMPFVLEAVKAKASLGEIVTTLVGVYGRHANQ